jgi:hypothetical protein
MLTKIKLQKVIDRQMQEPIFESVIKVVDACGKTLK